MNKLYHRGFCAPILSRVVGLASGLLLAAFSFWGVVQPVAAQTPETPWGWSSNLHQRIEVVKANASGTVTFTIAPEDQNKVARSHWPIVFIDYNNNGTQVTQMYNICEDTQFTVNVGPANGKVTIYGEDGLWKLVAKGQDLKAAELKHATALRYVDLSDNVLGTANSDAKFSFAAFEVETSTEEAKGNTNLQSLYLNNNRLKAIEFQPAIFTDLEELGLSENLFSTLSLTPFQRLSRIDLSKNLLTEIKLPSTMHRTASDIYIGGNYAAFSPTPASPGIYKNRTEATNWIDLSVNKLNIATLPRRPKDESNGTLPQQLPEGLPFENYVYTLQERYLLKPSRQGNDVYELDEPIDITDQSKIELLNKTWSTTYEWYVEEDAATDTYRLLQPGQDYWETGAGKFRFFRSWGKTMRVFAAMRTDAFPRPLESFERLKTPALTAYTNGFDGVTNQPAGGTQSPDRTSYKGTDGRPTANNNLGDGTARALDKRFFRTTTITIDATKQNYWYGYIDNDWNKPENWTARFVPATTPAEYADNEGSSVIFADNNNYRDGSAIRDLHVDNTRKIYEYVNLSKRDRAIVVPGGKRLQIVKGAFLSGSNAKSELSIARDDYTFRTVVKSEPGKANGTLLLGKGNTTPAASGFTVKDVVYVWDNEQWKRTPGPELPGYPATVEFYSKAFDGNRNKQDATWQYFGSPVKEAKPEDTFLSWTWVRKYNRTKNDEHDEKWEDINPATPLSPIAAYEISQPTPATYRFKGLLNLDNINVTDVSNAAAANTPYADWNIYANPYTAAMNISKIALTGSVDRAVYLFNTGTRKQWKALNQAAPPTGGDAGTGAGYYTAVPIEVAGRVPGLPEEIPSMNSFAFRATGSAATFAYSYKDLEEIDLENRSQGKSAPLPSLIVDVESEQSADRVVLVEAQEATERYDDGYDGEKIFTAGTAQLYAAGDRKYEVSSTDALDYAELGFVPADEAKEYTLSFTMSDELAARQYYLVDRKLRTTQAVQGGDSYRFTALPDDAPNRFLLTTKPQALDGLGAATSIDLRISAKHQLTATNHTSQEAQVEVFDLKGKRLMSFLVAPGTSETQTLEGVGVYVVKASNSEATVVERYRVH